MDFLKFMGDFLKDRKVMRQDLYNLVQKIPSSHVKNYVFRNKGSLTFENISQQWGIDSSSNSNGAAYADLDNDGDLDIVVNNISQHAFIYQNQSNRKSGNHYLQVQLMGNGGNTLGIGAKLTLYSKGKQQYLEQMPTRGFVSSVSPVLHFGIGDDNLIDSLRIVWLSGQSQLIKEIKPNQKIVVEEKNAKARYIIPARINALFTETKSPIPFQHAPNTINDFKRQPLMVNPMSFFGPCMAKADVNGDGLEDLFVGGAAGQTREYLFTT